MKPRLLDLFCGAGGAARGYQEAGFYVVGVDIKPQPRYSGDEFIEADALSCLIVGGQWAQEGFSAIHASPPCQGYVQRNKNLETKWPRLIEPTRRVLKRIGLPFVIENVEGAPLIDPVRLCGTFFGLPLRRHRLFECNGFSVFSTPCTHWGTVAHGDFAAVYSFGGKGPRRGGIREARPRSGAPSWVEAMQIDWMEKDEIREAIPPAYTRYIGEQLMRYIKGDN